VLISRATRENDEMPDDRNLIEHSDSAAGESYGEPMSIERIADNFALYGVKRRVAALERLDDELRGEIDSSPHNLRRRVQLMDHRQKMRHVHEALRKAKR
jgi:hypothetical protein